MKSLLKPKHYFNQKIFLNEKKIFNSSWMYVCTRDNLENENDFVTDEIFGIPIVIQNSKGLINGFINICAHRHSKIQIESKGNRPLMCPYHGWAYDKNGVPKGIPKKPLFKIEKDNLECLKLKKIDVEFCGNLVFVNLNPKKSLKEFIGEFTYNLLSKFEIQSKFKIDINEYEIKSNWKILVENTLEAYHVNLVHANTFKKLNAKGMNFKFDGTSSIWFADIDSKTNSKIENIFINKKFDSDNYIHILLFPNTLISSMQGKSYNISKIQPLSVDNSNFKSEVYVAPHKTNSLSKIYCKELVRFNREVFKEDTHICENIQKVIEHSQFDGQISDEEIRILHFQEKLLSELSE